MRDGDAEDVERPGRAGCGQLDRERERERFEELAWSGQKPEIMIIGCCESRVSPEVIFDARPGELFVVRNVANLVPPFETGGLYHGTSAALEFAVQALRVKHIVVLGHGRCGGVRAWVDDSEPLSPGDFIGKWMTLIEPAAAAAYQAAMQAVQPTPTPQPGRNLRLRQYHLQLSQPGAGRTCVFGSYGERLPVRRLVRSG